MFVLQMGVIVWGMGYLTLWFLFRSHKVWPAIVPGGMVLLINLYYAPNDITFWFITYMFVSLLLVIRFNLYTQESKWRIEGVFFRPDISFDFLRDGFIFSALVIAFAWLAPPVVDAKTVGLFDEFQGSWRDVQNEWNRMFADLNYRNRQAFDTFGSSLSLGGPRRLTNDPVMDVQVEGLGRYWRAVVYDYYTGDGWLTQDEDRASFGPDEPLSLPLFEGREVVTQTYTFYRDGATVIYAMSNPVQIDRTARVNFNALSNEEAIQLGIASWTGKEEPWVEEITYIRSNAAVDRGESYQVISLASRATVEELSTAGDDYPAWIVERYLQLPESISEQTKALAREVTEPYDNNFAKAQAVERFLRNELTYNESMAAPPSGVDKIHYVLFTGKEAYCDYYASSMIVMLRSLGIPARMAAGFARGTFDSEKDAFHVVNKDAHSWVEVYFPRYGWIEFEPTAAQPTIIRPSSFEDAGDFSSPGLPPENRPGLDEGAGRFDESLDLGGDFSGAGLPFIFNVPWLGFQISIPRAVVNSGATLAGLATLILIVAAGWWWRQQNQVDPSESIFSLYPRMIKFASWMGLAIRPWQTPYEHAAVLQRNLPSYQREVDAIASQFVYEKFSNHKDDPVALNGRSYSLQTYSPGVAWGRLRPAMLKEALRRRLPRWLRG
jgi:transglutaminase-like putative cysteine protease